MMDMNLMVFPPCCLMKSTAEMAEPPVASMGSVSYTHLCFTLNGKEYRLELNNGPNNLHSGPDYYEFRMWDAQVSEEELKISFALQSPDGDQGYPGNGDIIVTYTLTEDDAVEINYRMICDADTVVNFTNHSYFNLAGHDSGYIGAQKAWINADFFTPSDEFSIPTGELRPVDGTPMDLSLIHIF